MHPNDRRRGFVSRSVVVGDNPYHAPMRDSLRTFLDNIPTLVVIAYHNCNTCVFIRHLEYISHQHCLITKPSDIRLDIVLHIDPKAVGIVHIGQTIKKRSLLSLHSYMVTIPTDVPVTKAVITWPPSTKLKVKKLSSTRLPGISILSLGLKWE